MAWLAMLVGTFAMPAYGADIGRLRLNLTPDGPLGIDRARSSFRGEYSVGIVGHYARDPLVWRYRDDTIDPAIRDQWMTELHANLGLFRLVDLSLGLPVLLSQNIPPGADIGAASGGAMGDLRILPRVTLVYQRSYGFQLAVIPEVTVPTGNVNKFNGEENVSFRPRVVASVPLWGFELSGSLGYRWRENTRIETARFADEIETRVGAAFDLADPDIVPVVELANTFKAVRLQNRDHMSMEVVGGARIRVAGDYVATIGAAAGLIQGIGTPIIRGILGVSIAPPPSDRDADGIPDAADRCPSHAEDYDRFADVDGCPDVDNDLDGIIDVKDDCPNEREDVNGIDDEDGCPDAQPSDGIYDGDDPLKFDTDGDGVTDDMDPCPGESEDFDDFEDQDGCPDLDHDYDGVLNENDKCPQLPETINGIRDEDGCPDSGEADAVVTEGEIRLKKAVYFATGKAEILDKSFPLLDQVALAVLANPRIRILRIEGHTDSRGNDETNLLLSQARADAVREYLESKGVPRSRLESIGYGEERPIATNDTERGRAMNRRVVFVIVQ